MRISKLLAMALVVAALPACSTWNLNVHDTPPEFPDPLPLDGYFNTDGMRDYDGNIIDASFLGTGARKGELFHIELWPFVGVGVGAFGARLQLLPLDMGIGTIFYEPSAPTGGGDAADGGE